MAASFSFFHSTILVTYLNLLLQHMQRFYRWSIEDRLDECKLLQQNFISGLHTFFDKEANSLIALPTLVSLAKKLNHTTRFLNDVSLKISGSTAQHHIDNFIVTIVKE